MPVFPVYIIQVLHKLAGCDEEHELLRDMLLMVLRIAEISPEDAPKVITEEMMVITNEVMDSLDRIKHSFNREMQNIYYNVKQIHLRPEENVSTAEIACRWSGNRPKEINFSIVLNLRGKKYMN
ncbi:hypothetical protein CHS0354_022645 [Potamilus streckersoni]|uniref:Uncharacterized protein n=1 Tax=Potamilus streckersoni TaxID=2493646 RepID=A0AAE0TG51_9BIVA|nr:hypothetical protein CHS0354_022645 [Potamilus streckersoni]